MLTIAYVLGTRPEVIRSAAMLELMSTDPEIELQVIDTGQHYDDDMLGGFLRELSIPHLDARLSVGSAAAAEQTARVMQGVHDVLAATTPRCVCVFGDTNSSLGAGLAAVKTEIPLVHIEAGCRSYDMRMPEEINRRTLDHVSTLLLAVSELAAENLRREQVPGEIRVVGDPQYDVFRRQASGLATRARRDRGLITLHRPENVDDPERLAAILDEIAAADADVVWQFPVHPRTRPALPSRISDRIVLVGPASYAELLQTLFSSRVCVTDSGGLQKEALWARVPCVTVRRTTEWMETVWASANILAQPGENLTQAIESQATQRLSEQYENPYGDGHASEYVVRALKDWSWGRATSGWAGEVPMAPAPGFAPGT